ncbi:GGDEF domain-containing protein [Vibrio chagasii]|nr:GGDEF domain-containing protein [Vibrio chagasii]
MTSPTAWNRRALFNEAEKVLAKRCFAQKVMACLFVDVDKFKSIRPMTYGHKLYDDVLAMVARVLDDVHGQRVPR